MNKKVTVLESKIDAISLKESIDRIEALAIDGSSSVICLANVHMVVTALDDKRLSNVMKNAELVLPDGMPIVLSIRKKKKKQERVAGFDVISATLERCENANIDVAFVGTTQKTLGLIKSNIESKYEKLSVTYVELPFFSIDDNFAEEQKDLIKTIPSGVMFVGLGCPKQEIWMDKMRPHTKCAMIGVGAAFHLLSGEFKRAPYWMRRLSLEWLYRLSQEPRKLFRRYLETNIMFTYYSFFGMSRAPKS